jgi:hypothetical protein
VNYQVNVGASRGLVTYHINLLKRYNRNRVMNIFVEHESVSDMLPDMAFLSISTIGLLHGLLEGTMCPSFSIWFKSFFTSSRRA